MLGLPAAEALLVTSVPRFGSAAGSSAGGLGRAGTGISQQLTLTPGSWGWQMHALTLLLLACLGGRRCSWRGQRERAGLMLLAPAWQVACSVLRRLCAEVGLSWSLFFENCFRAAIQVWFGCPSLEHVELIWEPCLA